jgi:thiol:disulfide interchange protein
MVHIDVLSHRCLGARMRFLIGRTTVGMALLAAVACGSSAKESSAAGEAAVPEPLAAEMVVANALRVATSDEQSVLVEFGASWCVWCDNFQAMVESDDAGPILADNYVIVNLTVREEGDKKALENPGGDEMMAQWNGSSSGLPFYVFLDSAGNKIGDSNAMPDGTNIGFPVSETEIERFMELVDRTAPRVDETERAVLLEYLQRSAAALQ